jgi:hypothetical protein
MKLNEQLIGIYDEFERRKIIENFFKEFGGEIIRQEKSKTRAGVILNWVTFLNEGNEYSFISDSEISEETKKRIKSEGSVISEMQHKVADNDTSDFV